jgi:energy-coupling factor transporter ATP-binding protein EcfA2
MPISTIGLSYVVASLGFGLAVGGIAAWLAPQLAARRSARRYRRRLEQRPLRIDDAPGRAEDRTVPQAPPELIHALSQGRCVLFGGAELSAQSGIPTGDDLLSAMLDRVEVSHPRDDWAALRDQHEAGQADLVAELLRRRLGPDGVRDVLLSIFGARRATQTRSAFGALAKAPFVGVVTNQWDDALTRAFADRDPVALTPAKSRQASDVLREERFFALKLFGDLVDPDDLLFTGEDYREAIQKERTFGLFVASLLSSRTFLFVGTTAREIEDFMSASGARRAANQHHVALVPGSRGLPLIAERMRERFGVTLLAYPASLGFEAVQFFIEHLNSAAVRSRPTKARAREKARLEHIELEDVGPFRHLDLDLGSDWTVMLGDNASGKSTILRAIALALCGESPPTTVAPTRLLRSGASRGTIAARVGKATYRIELRREGSHVRTVSDSVTPIQAGSWLALGFPPLRGISTEDPRGAVLMPSRAPNPDDLLPLLVQDIDTRMNDVKQWVQTTWLLANDRHGSSKRPARMLAEFFEILQRLTPGIDFTFSGVNTDSGEIRLDSPDGAITIDMLSQGISSLLAWVGVLLERMYEVYEDDENPTRRDALVLVDEIDAHLHPDWQRLLIPELRKIFPNVQLVATTHSPLIVGNTRPGEVVHLAQRDGVRTHERLEMPFGGMRADQILTSAAFELNSTRDPATTHMLEEYRSLTRQPEQTEESKRRLIELQQQVRSTLPYPQETEAQREAARRVMEWTDQRLTTTIGEMTGETREAVAEETRAYLARLERPRADP